MTTIAYKDGVMASDSLTLSGFKLQTEHKKLHRINGDVLGVAAVVQEKLLFLRWYQNQDEPKPSPEHLKNFSALAFRDGKLMLANDLCEFVEVGNVYAIGSGADFAMGAMLHGATAKEAVKVACQLDECSGLPVRAMKVK